MIGTNCSFLSYTGKGFFCPFVFALFQIAKVGGAPKVDFDRVENLEEEESTFFVTIDLAPNSQTSAIETLPIAPLPLCVRSQTRSQV